MPEARVRSIVHLNAFNMASRRDLPQRRCYVMAAQRCSMLPMSERYDLLATIHIVLPFLAINYAARIQNHQTPQHM
jgi:3-oxoacyl-ACP reductase-like protein